jgi:hypothetical protein
LFPEQFEISKESNMSTINVSNNQYATVNNYEYGAGNQPANAGSDVAGRAPIGGNPKGANDPGWANKPPILPAHRSIEEKLDALLASTETGQTALGRVQDDLTKVQAGINNLQGGQNAIQTGVNGLQGNVANVAAGQARIENEVKDNLRLTAAATTANTVQFNQVNAKLDDLKIKCSGSLHASKDETRTPTPIA